MDEERVQPMRITDNDTGEVYELDFSRESIMFMESQGFKVDEAFDFPVTKIPRLFYFAFRKNHRKIAQSQTDKLLAKIGGLTPKMIERIVALYNQTALANNVQTEEDLAENPHVTVELS